MMDAERYIIGKMVKGVAELPANQPVAKSRFLEEPMPDKGSRWKRY